MTPTTLPRRTTVEPLLPGDFDDNFTDYVNSKRRKADMISAAWTLRWPLAIIIAFHITLIAFAIWFVR
jgi:hypothetical protein